ncbi:MAG: hypothetical protein CM15mP120_01680 [Pseudomonadota bacterium]|nr:MAG: hypothetical protein CM15mP120_01680 [Pseudomonadota bacterium]
MIWPFGLCHCVFCPYWCCFMVACLSGQALADTLSLYNGDQLTGTLVSISEQQVVFETTYAGAITVEQRAIRRLQTTRAYVLRGAAFEQQGVLAVIDDQQGSSLSKALLLLT